MGQVEGSKAGIIAGAQVTYDYKMSVGYLLPNNTYYMKTGDNRFTVNVLSIDNSHPPGIIGYVETFTLYNDTTVNESVNGTTPFFDPYDNMTYVGNIGFYPFMYTDVPTGSSANIPVSLTLQVQSNTSITNVNRINVTVSRASRQIIVNITMESGPQLPPSYTYLSYNASNGVLLYGKTDFTLLGADRGFVYTLSSYTPGSNTQGGLPLFPLIDYLAFGSFAGLAIVGITRLFFRDKRRGKRFKGVKRQIITNLL